MSTVLHVHAKPREQLVEVTGALEQTSTNTETAVTGSNLDAGPWTTIAYTVINSDEANTVQFSVYGANVSDFSDETVVSALTDIAPLAAGSYSTTQVAFRYYRVKIHSKVDNAHSACVVNGICKP